MNNDKTRYILVHHHIFKNAGTSFNFALRNTFGTHFSEYDLPNSNIVTTHNLYEYLENNKNLKAISGHHICLPSDDNSRSIKTLSSVIIRDPLARIHSIYNFERKQNANTDGAIMAKKLNFKDFVTWRLEQAPQVFCNYQTLYCSRKNDSLQYRDLSEADLNVAIENLERCLAIGTVKRYNEFLMIAQYKLSQYFPNIYLTNTHLNISSKSNQSSKKADIKVRLTSDLGEELVHTLEKLNQLDYKLYDFINKKLNQWTIQNLEQKVDYFINTANSCFKNKDFHGAILMFNHSLDLDLNSFKSYYGLAETFEQIEDYPSSILNYKKAIQKRPNFAWSYFKLGNILFQQEKFEDALEYFSQALAIHPYAKSFIFYIHHGDTLFKLSRFDEALISFQKSTELSSDSLNAIARILLVYLTKNDIKSFNSTINQSLDLGFGYCDIYEEMGDTLLKYGDTKLAVKYYKLGLKYDSKGQKCTKKLSDTLKKFAFA